MNKNLIATSNLWLQANFSLLVRRVRPRTICVDEYIVNLIPNLLIVLHSVSAWLLHIQNYVVLLGIGCVARTYIVVKKLTGLILRHLVKKTPLLHRFVADGRRLSVAQTSVEWQEVILHRQITT
jgi:hypothetical protein